MYGALEMTERHTASVGVPILDGEQGLVGAISIIVEASRPDIAHLATPMKAVARGISRNLDEQRY